MHWVSIISGRVRGALILSILALAPDWEQELSATVISSLAVTGMRPIWGTYPSTRMGRCVSVADMDVQNWLLPGQDWCASYGESWPTDQRGAFFQIRLN